MNIDNNIKASTPEFDKTYLKERFGLSHLEDTLQINNYVDILSLIYNKINTTKKTKFDNINYEYPAEIKSILDLFNSGKCEIIQNNEIFHNVLINMTPIICIKNINNPISFLCENFENDTEYVEFCFGDTKRIILNHELYDITSDNNKYILTSINSQNIITIESKPVLFHIKPKEKQENLFNIFKLVFNINDDEYILFNTVNKNTNNLCYETNFEIILILDELYKEYLNSSIFKNINKLSIFNQTYDKLLNIEKKSSIWHSVKTPFNLTFCFVDDEMNFKHYIDFNVFLPPSDKFIKLSDKKIDQYCEYIKN